MFNQIIGSNHEESENNHKKIMKGAWARHKSTMCWPNFFNTPSQLSLLPLCTVIHSLNMRQWQP